MNELKDLIKIKNSVTGEIKLFPGLDTATDFIKKNQEYVLWSA